MPLADSDTLSSPEHCLGSMEVQKWYFLETSAWPRRDSQLVAPSIPFRDGMRWYPYPTTAKVAKRIHSALITHPAHQPQYFSSQGFQYPKDSHIVVQQPGEDQVLAR